MRIFVLGGVSYDTIAHVSTLPTAGSVTLFPKSLLHAVGSTGSGKALTLHQLGADVILHGLVGSDMEGQKIRDFFQESGLCALWDIDPSGTPTHFNIMDDTGGRISIFTNPGTFEPRVDEKRIEDEIKSADIVILNIIQYTRRFIPLLRKYQKEVWVDLHDYDGHNPYHQDYLEIADALFLSADQYPKEKLGLLLSHRAKFVVMTDGDKGASYLDRSGTIIHQKAFSAKLVDANGAGDAFFSAYLFAHIHQASVKECLSFASFCAAKTVESELIFSAALTADTYESFRKENR